MGNAGCAANDSVEASVPSTPLPPLSAQLGDELAGQLGSTEAGATQVGDKAIRGVEAAPPPSSPEGTVPRHLAPEVDRRAFRRAPLDRPVLLETATKTTTVRSVDVSGGGIALRTDLPLGLKERLSIYFELPIGFAVEAQAEVVRQEGELVVLRFIEAPPQAVLAVRSFCRISGLMPASKRAPF